MLSHQVGVVHGGGEQRGALPRGHELGGGQVAQCLPGLLRFGVVGHAISSSRSSAGQRSLLTYWSMKASTAAVTAAGAAMRLRASLAAAKHALLTWLIAGSAGPNRAARTHGPSSPPGSPSPSGATAASAASLA